MRPMFECTPEATAKYSDFLVKIQQEQPDNAFFINMLKDTITDLKIKWRGCQASAQYFLNIQESLP